MIVVTGANGGLGRLVVENLLQRVAASEVGVSTRDVSKAGELAARGVRVRHGDFADPASLRDAFDGAEQVLIVSGTSMGEEGLRQHGHAIDAAKAAGARRILYTSHQNASPEAIFVPGKRHAATEALLRDSGVPFVSLRNGFYAESALYQLGGLKATNTIALPADGPVSWTARADLAEAAALVLTDPGLLEDGISPPLTAPRTWTFEQVAGAASKILGREIKREVIADEDFRKRMITHGVPEPMASMLLTLYTGARGGEFDVVDPTLGRLLDREPAAFPTVLAGFLA